MNVKIRCQSPLRPESRSVAAFVTLARNGDLVMYDSGLSGESHFFEPNPQADFAVAVAPDQNAPPSARRVFSNSDLRHGTETTKPLTESGNAERLHEMTRGRLLFCQENGTWLYWSGRWVSDAYGGFVTSLARSLPEQLYQEALVLVKEGRPDALTTYAKFVLASQRAAAISSAITLLSKTPGVGVSLCILDNDHTLVGLDGGRKVVDLTRGSVRIARPEDLVTKSLGVSELGSPDLAVRWIQFLRDVLVDETGNPDHELIDWFQRWCGYMLTGSTEEQILLFFVGHGANGKSVLVKVLEMVMGDYSRVVQTESLMSTRRDGQAASPDIASLVGARLVTAAEAEEDATLAESRIKQLVGGDKVSARHLYGTQIEFIPRFKLVMTGNHKPRVRGNDHGIWRRIVLIPFRRTFGQDKADPRLIAKLEAELPHILAWMVEGHKQWKQQSLRQRPPSVITATDDYRQEQDTLGQWMEERCIVKPDAFTATSSLFGAYVQWSIGCGLPRSSMQGFARRLGERLGVKPGKQAGVRGFLGIQLKTGAVDLLA